MMKEAFDFLKEHKDEAFATVSGNRPCLRVFQVMKIDGTTLYFATSPKKEVYTQLQQNPAVEILGSAGNISVRMAGEISFDVPDDVQKEIYDTNWILQDLYLSYEAMVYCKMDVKFIEYYDLTPRPPRIERFTL